MINFQHPLDMQNNNVPQFNKMLNDNMCDSVKIEIITQKSQKRKEVEKFIYNSYSKSFDTSLISFFPIIITAVRTSDNKILSTVGVRYSAENNLFSEFYLSNPIESYIEKNEKCKVERKHILEIGNLATAKSKYIKTVMPLLKEILKSMNYKWLVFTLSSQMKTYMSLFEINLRFIDVAKKEAKNPAALDWGHYYDFLPAIYYSKN